MQIGDYAACIEDYNIFIERDPTNPWARLERGDCYRELGDLDLAREDYETFLAMIGNEPGWEEERQRVRSDAEDQREDQDDVHQHRLALGTAQQDRPDKRGVKRRLPEVAPDLAGWQDMMWVVERNIQVDPVTGIPEMHFFNNNLIAPSGYAGIHPQLVAGGHAYGTTYPGPIGAVLNPALMTLGEWGDLAHASSLCGACLEVCPTGSRKFGNILDPDSEVAYILRHKRVYVFKEEVGTIPRFFYYFDERGSRYAEPIAPADGGGDA